MSPRLRSLVAAALFLAQATLAADGEELRVSAAVEGRLSIGEGAADARRCEHPLRVERAGPVRIELSSFDFDARLELRDADGGLLASASDGAPGGDAVLEWEAAAGASYRVVAAAEGRPIGEYRLSVAAVVEEDPAAVEARLEALERRAEAARAGGDARGETGALIELGQALQDLGRAAAALDRFRAARERAGEIESEPWRRLLVCYAALQLGGALRQRGELEDALAELERARAGCSPQTDRGLRRAVFEALYRCRLERGELEEAAAVAEQWLELVTHDGDRLAATVARGWIAEALRGAGRADEAGALLDEGVAEAEEGGGEALAGALLARAIHRMASGAGAAAQADLERALEPELGAASDWLRAACSGNLGRLLVSRGHFWEGRRALREALGLAARGGWTELEVKALLALAGAATWSDEPTGALRHLDRAAALVPAGSREASQIAHQLGLALERLGRVPEARARHERAIEVAERLDDPEVLAEAWINVGRFADRQQDLELLRDSTERALAVCERGGVDALLPVARSNRAWYAFRAGDAGRAAELAEAVLAGERLSDETRLQALDTLARAGLELGELARARRAFDEAERLLEGMLAEETDWETAAARRSVHADLARVAQDLIAAEARAQGLEGEEHARRGLAAACRWKGRSLRGPEDAGREDAAFDLDALRAAALPPDGALLEFAAGTEDLLAYVVTREGARVVRVGPREELLRRADRYLNELLLEPDCAVAELLSEGRALFDALLAAPLGPDAERGALVLVPVAGLAALPFEALVEGPREPGASPASCADLRFAIDRWSITYAPSSSFLCAPRAPLRPLGAGGRLLVLGDPVYAGSAALGDPFERLEGTREEAVGLASRALRAAGLRDEYAGRLLDLADRRSGALETPVVRVLLGERASPAALRSEAPGCSILHCAVHGFVDRDDPWRTGLALSFGPRRSGELLVPEIAGLAFDADLAVLSGCETARGRIRRGDGVQSMAHAFLRAGSQAVVASLWRVHDQDTADLMEDFYRGLLEQGRSPADALRAAKIALRGRAGERAGVGLAEDGRAAAPPRAHPVHWAAFVLSGRAR